MNDSFESLLVSLVRHEVKFLVVGGVAVSLNGFVRATYDLDLLVEDSEDNLQRLLQVLENFGEGSARELQTADFPAEEGAVRVVEDFQVDIFTRMRGADFHQLSATARTFAIEGTEFRFLSAEALIQLKAGSFRQKDQIDTLELQRLKRASFGELPPMAPEETDGERE